MPVVMRDQLRARKAYDLVGRIEGEAARKNYKITVNSFGANIIRLGFSAALAELQRRGEDGGVRMLAHLADALNESNLPGVGNELSESNLVGCINELPASQYMLATREVMQRIAWFRRAVQAIF